MDNIICYSCQSPKPSLKCETCHETICKSCAQFLDDDSFSFMAKIPPALSYKTYCTPCFTTHVSADLEAYNNMIEQAKDILVFDKDQSKETRLMKRTEKPYSVDNCADRDEALLRLAFFAVQAGFNALIDVNITSQKIRNGSYQTSRWHGTAIPTQLNKGRY